MCRKPTVLTEKVIEISDLVLVPLRPSPHALRAVSLSLKAIDKFDKSKIFVLNGATSNAKINSDALIALSQYGPIAQPVVHNRIIFAEAMINGKIANEISPKSKAAKEMFSLWNYVKSQIHK